MTQILHIHQLFLFASHDDPNPVHTTKCALLVVCSKPSKTTQQVKRCLFAKFIANERAEPFDVSKSGEYAVVGCGSANAANVVDLLETLWSALLPAIQDAESATPSRAYQTFFKNVEYASYVSNVLANVSTGASLYPPTKFTNGAPVLTCVTAAGQFKYKITTTGQEEDAYTECLRKPTEVAKSMSGTSFIILCPNFFTSPSMPAKPPPNNCLTVNTYINRFQGFQKDRTGAEMVQYQLWVLLEEILHYYIFRTSSQWETLTIADIYDANQCLRLSAKDSTENPHNYLYYVASEFCLSVSI